MNEVQLPDDEVQLPVDEVHLADDEIQLPDNKAQAHQSTRGSVTETSDPSTSSITSPMYFCLLKLGPEGGQKGQLSG